MTIIGILLVRTTTVITNAKDDEGRGRGDSRCCTSSTLVRFFSFSFYYFNDYSKHTLTTTTSNGHQTPTPMPGTTKEVEKA